jgi:hypothetical protein
MGGVGTGPGPGGGAGSGTGGTGSGGIGAGGVGSGTGGVVIARRLPAAPPVIRVRNSRRVRELAGGPGEAIFSPAELVAFTGL